jgi:hypothetical protein
MSQNRLPLLLGLLALVLGIRWSDLLGRTKTVQAVSEPVERSAGRPVMAHAQVASMQSGPAWPVRTASHEKNAGNAFMTRAEAAAQAIKRQPPAPAPQLPPAYVAPPPPVDPPPPLQVIGTWGDGNDFAVFLSGPQGTVLARPNDVIMAQYRVQSITKQQVTLLQNSNQHVWNISIPTLPSTPQTWLGR